MKVDVRALNTLTEIRLRWCADTVWSHEGGPGGGLWFPATDFNRAKLTHAVERGNQCFGGSTHWLEERQA